MGIEVILNGETLVCGEDYTVNDNIIIIAQSVGPISLKNRAENLLSILKKKPYDNEVVHIDYDAIMEEMVLNYDASLLPLFTELINLQKDFWHA